MTYSDNSANSVHSLLALLRSAQDGSAPSTTSFNAVTSASTDNSHATHHTQLANSLASKPSIPSKRQLDDLLTSLNARPPPPATKHEPSRRASLIEPFGPVGETSSPSKSPHDPKQSPSRRRDSVEASTGNYGRAGIVGEGGTNSPPKKKKKPSERVNEEGYDLMSFSKALPVLSELLEDEGFKAELKKMKKEQDSLERRLWAKGEKAKAEHEKSIQAEKEVAKIARKVIPPEKKEAWAKSLSASLSNFYLQQCLPNIDGLATRQRQRLIELGVPGLGDDGDKGRDRVKRIMELLEAGLEE
ncbi:uncharacterized protein L201_005477 [Kwoniella dendrophila CBS 6074]|uniref:Uncharacterized protein n=1 Tax=Kwoniella dendrophila CBS 6074 TaxID=1295534 RepID=A0AAX4JYP5_9TREE